MKEKVKRLFALALAMSMMLALASCGGSTSQSSTSEEEESAPTSAAAEPEESASTDAEEENPATPVSGTSDETLKVCLDEEPSIILSLVGNVGTGSYVAQCLYDTLLSYDSDTKEIGPRLATDWEWLDDTHLQLTLRDDVVAYDGTILTASDVMYSVEQGLAGDATTQWKYVDGAECSVVDDTTFILGLTETHPTMINMLANIAMLTVIDESSVEANGGYEACQRDPKCNTGAYNLVEWKNGEKITLERNENYWGEPGYYKTIEFTFVNDSAARVMSLSSGQINVAVNLTGADVLSVSDPDVVESVATGGCYVIFMNVNNEYLSNELVREAIFYAVDVNAMNQVGTTGLNQLASSLVPTSNAYYVAPDSSYDHTVDLDKAKELLAQAGYPDGFDLYMPIMAGQQSECEVLQACLLQIGINLKLEVVELPVFLAATDTGDLDFSYQRTTPDDIINMVNYFDDRLEPMSRGGGIIGGFAEMYDMIDGCRYATDETESAAYWKEFQDYTRDNYLYIPVYEDCFFSAMDGSYTFQNDQIGYINFATMRPVG